MSYRPSRCGTGLSAVVRIDTRQPGRSVLEPLTTTPSAYKTEVYDRQLEGAEALIRQIIEANRVHKALKDNSPGSRHS